MMKVRHAGCGLEDLLDELRQLLAKGDAILSQANGRPDLSGVTLSQLKRVEIIVDVVSHRMEVSHRKIYSKSQIAGTVLARQVCMSLVRSKVGLPQRKVGTLFHRDHMTVIHAEETVNDRILTDMKFALLFAEINIQVERQFNP